MKPGRDWYHWGTKVYNELLSGQTLIVKMRLKGFPFPLYTSNDIKRYRMPSTPIFTIKAWGTKGYK